MDVARIKQHAGCQAAQEFPLPVASAQSKEITEFIHQELAHRKD